MPGGSEGRTDQVVACRSIFDFDVMARLVRRPKLFFGAGEEFGLWMLQWR